MNIVLTFDAEAEAEVIKGCCGQPDSVCDCVKEQ